MHPMLSLISLTILVSSLLPLHYAWSVEPAGQSSGLPVTVTSERLNAKLKEVEATVKLDEATKTKLTELYHQALSNLEKGRSYQAPADRYEQAIASAAAQAASIREALGTAVRTSPADALQVEEQTPLAEVEQQLLKTKADLAAVEAKLSQLEGQVALETNRPDTVRKRLTEAKQLMEELAGESKLPAAADQSSRLIQARRWRLQTRTQALGAEIGMLDLELRSQPMRMALLKAQRDKEAHSIDFVGAQVQLLEEIVNQRRRVQAEQAEAEAEAVKQDARGKHPLVEALATKNVELSEGLGILTANIEGITSKEDSAQKRAARVEADYRSAKHKFEVAGHSQALGRVLLEQRRSLPVAQRFRKQSRQRERLIADASLRQIVHQEERGRLRNIYEYIDQLSINLSREDSDRIRSELVLLAEQRRALLDKVTAADDAYLRVLLELHIAYQRLFIAVTAYSDFLAERLLWIRSSPALNLGTLLAVRGQLLQLFSPYDWLEVGRVLKSRAVQSPVLGITSIIIILLVWNHRRLRRRLQSLGEKVGRPSVDRFLYTLRVFALTLLLAAPWPLLMAIVGWQLGLAAETTDFSRAISEALLWVSPVFFFLRAFRLLCYPGGLADRHFQWPEFILKHLRRELGRFMLIFLPVSFLAVVSIEHDSVTLGGGIGRLSFMIMMCVVAYFLYRLFSPRWGVLQAFYKRDPTSLLTRLRYLWLLLGVVSPLSFLALALVGYLYTAGVLTTLLMETMGFILTLLIVQQLAMRLLLMTRRRLILQSVRERRDGLEPADSPGKSGYLSEEAALGDVEEPQVDLVALSEESCKLLNTALVIAVALGLWFIWSDVLPAFRILDEFTLWHQTGMAAGEEKLLPVTLADAGLAIIVLIITIVAARSVPALLEIILLQRLDVSSGSRYAFTALSGYLIAVVGVLIAFNVFGVDWSKLQWLVAALGVGIGFGLQEIVANFISGIIILFEQPIRVGDVVTVGDTDGIVTRVRIRATTIRNRDRKELLVPNKEFITGRVLNWSLSDETTRIMFPIGLAYGSDVQQAMALIAEAAEQNELVLAEPTPFVAFEGFGDNALTLTLRCFIGSVDYRIPVISELHQAINDKFNDAGIVIAFPQVDVHLDTSRPLEVRIAPNEGT